MLMSAMTKNQTINIFLSNLCTFLMALVWVAGSSAENPRPGGHYWSRFGIPTNHKEMSPFLADQ
jgi:hypothetical protein